MGRNQSRKPEKPKSIATAEFEALMSPLGIDGSSPCLAVAVSGGADSMVLAALACDWVKARDGTLTALIVDHGLRPESGDEAGCVRKWLGDQRISAEILEWRGIKPETGVQAAARAARYRLLTEWCAGQDIVDLLLAHHRDDQAETFLLRLGRGSGIDGLACMAPVSASPVAEPSGVRLLRPLLPVQKSRLIATAESLNIPWVEDPSNRDTAFARVRVRDALTGLAEEGLTSQRLAAAARRMERASHALRAATQELLAGSIRRDRAGYCEIGLEDFFRAPDEIALRALGQMLQWVGGPEATPRLERLERLYERLATAGPFGGRTLGGCRIHVRTGASGHRLRVFREPEAADQVLPLPPGTGGVWDGRFRVALTSGGVESGEAAVVRRLGDEGWREIAPAVPDKVRRQLPALARPSLPALWDRTGVLSVPLAGYQRPETGLESRFNLGVFTTEAAWRGAPEELA